MHRKAFTIIELMVAISIIAILMGIVLAAVNAMGVGTRETAAVNTIAVAVEVARYRATTAKNDVDLTAESPPGVNNVSYDGAAAVFSPSGEIRIVEHDQRARTTGGTYLADEATPLYGFRDVSTTEFVRLPGQITIQGLSRSGGTDYLLDPPFAIRFNRFGQMVVATDPTPTTAERYVIYDGDHDGRYEFGDDRGTYVIADFDAAAAWDKTYKKHKFTDLERLECVIGIRITTSSGETRDVYFSRYTGAVLRNN